MVALMVLDGMFADSVQHEIPFLLSERARRLGFGTDSGYRIGCWQPGRTVQHDVHSSADD